MNATRAAVVGMLSVVAGLTLSACETPYQAMGFAGGVEANQITSDIYRITARGNGYTSASMVQDYALLKAAEVTHGAGGTHFLVVTAADTTRQQVGQTPGQAQTNIYGTTAYTTYTPGTIYSITKPGQDLYVRLLNVPSGTRVPDGAYRASEIIQIVGARVKRP